MKTHAAKEIEMHWLCVFVYPAATIKVDIIIIRLLSYMCSNALVRTVNL
jgi:hypothetical protein